MERTRLTQLLVCGLVCALMYGAGWYSHDWFHHRNGRNAHRRIVAKGFRYTSPLLDVEMPPGVRVGFEPIPFKYKVENYVRSQQQNGNVSSISVYYRDLNDGPWFGINEDVEFNPASMMKVPLMIAWLKRAEKDPGVLKRILMYDGKEDLNASESIKPKRAIIAGKSYSVDELLRYMLNYSDNNATTLLYNDMDAKELGGVIDGMDIDNHPNDEGNRISAHSFSGFLRILYNASFLNREFSEKALWLLTMDDFPQGISAGVPNGVSVASKFGEFSRGVRAEEKELHEFGIVYHPKEPYILGVMTRGNNIEKQSEVIRGISQLIYKEIDANISRYRGR